MPKLLYAPSSPYSAKVRMAAHYAGFPVEGVTVVTSQDPAELVSTNPLGKIPTLVLDDGSSVYDSRVITQYLNRVSGNKLFPRNPQKRLEAEQLEALADGICDCLLAHVYERRDRPQECVYQPWLDRQWEKATRGLDLLNANTPRVTTKLNGGQIALAAMLSYLNLRFEGKWERGRPKLKRWLTRFQELHPEVAAFLPK
ncbi:MAG: glutathione S-transferase [Phyllobacterium sp.]